MDDLLDGKIETAGPELTQDTMKTLSFFKDLDAAAKDYTVPSPEWCAELYEVREQLESLKKREAKLLEVAKAKKDRGSFVHGGYTLKVTERAGNKTLDKDALLKRIEDQLGSDEVKVYVQACTKQGKPSVVVSVEKIGSTQGDGSVGEGL